MPNVKQHLVCSFTSLYTLLLSLYEFLIPECIQTARHLIPAIMTLNIFKIAFNVQNHSVIHLNPGEFTHYS